MLYVTSVQQGCVCFSEFGRVTQENSEPTHIAHSAEVFQARRDLPSNMLLWLREKRGV